MLGSVLHTVLQLSLSLSQNDSDPFPLFSDLATLTNEINVTQSLQLASDLCKDISINPKYLYFID